jgi:YegS/Rv2252/BmrU family lipid kinase
MDFPVRAFNPRSTDAVTPEMIALDDSLRREASKPSSAKEYRAWFIFNPAANRGEARSKLKRLESALISSANAAIIQLTTKKGDAIDFALHASKKADVVVACGGDGTVNETAQSLVGGETALGILPLGSGNDFFKNFSIPKSLSKAYDFISIGKPRWIDAGKATFTSNGIRQTRYFFNSLGVGFTGEIAKYASRSPLKGEWMYLNALMYVARRYQAAPMQVELESECGPLVLNESVFALTIGNGKIEGGKFRIAPTAKLNDGLLDACALHSISSAELPRYVLQYLQGSQLRAANQPRSKVVYQKVRRAVISLSREEQLHLDGEAFENISDTLVIECIPNALQVLDVHSTQSDQ